MSQHAPLDERGPELLLAALIEHIEQTGERFHSGSFCIHDPDGRWYWSLRGCSLTYRRISSHSLPGSPTQYGIDLVEPVVLHLADGSERCFRHLLLAQYQVAHKGQGIRSLFLKPEPYGTFGCWNKTLHWCEWIRTRPCWRREHSDYIFRKERMDKRYEQAYKNLAKAGLGCGIISNPKFVFQMLMNLDPESQAALTRIIEMDLELDARLEMKFAARLGREVHISSDVATQILDQLLHDTGCQAESIPTEHISQHNNVLSLGTHQEHEEKNAKDYSAEHAGGMLSSSHRDSSGDNGDSRTAKDGKSGIVHQCAHQGSNTEKDGDCTTVNTVVSL
eukprot:TRINITY_DN43860_c0_g1_i2.p1 TRINITY_DN43860_c0_g1~~TRINITY_DN43860_c0_g1_i2.p1  ORF type:complete len:334 (-),score=41.00 TRINITY_DN43860_c0_g1_i2:252-1253(-)